MTKKTVEDESGIHTKDLVWVLVVLWALFGIFVAINQFARIRAESYYTSMQMGMLLGLLVALYLIFYLPIKLCWKYYLSKK